MEKNDENNNIVYLKDNGFFKRTHKNSTKSAVEKLNIYELREYARKVGIESPTSKTKEQLLEEISE